MANQMQGPRVRSEIQERLGNKIYDRKTWSIYDTATVPAAGTLSELEFFKQPIGQGTSSIFAIDSPVKNISDTNMKEATLSKGENMVVYYVGVQWGVANVTLGAPTLQLNGLNMKDASLISQGVLEVTRANDAIALQQPLWKLPAGGGIGNIWLSKIGTADATVNNIKSYGNGSPFSSAKQFLRRNPIVIRAQESFGVKIRWGSTINPENALGRWIQVHLEGEMWKEII